MSKIRFWCFLSAVTYPDKTAQKLYTVCGIHVYTVYKSNLVKCKRRGGHVDGENQVIKVRLEEWKWEIYK